MVVGHKHLFPSSQDTQLPGLMTVPAPWADLHPRGQDGYLPSSLALTAISQTYSI